MLLLILILPLLPNSALAHVKWFVPSGHALATEVMPYALTETAVQLGLLLSLLALAASLWLNRRLPAPILPRGLQQAALDLLPYGTGISLLLSAWSGNILAPHYHWDGPTATALLLLQAAAGFLLLFPPLVLAGALGMLALYGGLLLLAGPAALEYLNLAALAGFLVLSKRRHGSLQLPAAQQALPLLRIGTGLALLLLAIQEKLLRPDYGTDFVSRYLWNFMANLGLGFDDRYFVLAAGLVEAILGLLLVLGSTTRLCVLVISGFMLSSNLAFLLQGQLDEALTEITGHLPIICTALILLVFDQRNRCSSADPAVAISRPASAITP